MGIFTQKFTTERGDHTSPEHYLWTSVLSKAAHDAMYSSDWREARLAISWFKGKGAGFREVCELAGKDPNYVYTRMMKVIVGRENNMEAIRSGAKKRGRPKKNMRMVLQGSKGGRPRLYDGI